MHQRIVGVRDGKEIPLPQELDYLCIETSKGAIYVDLGSPIPDMVLLRPNPSPRGEGRGETQN